MHPLRKMWAEMYEDAPKKLRIDKAQREEALIAVRRCGPLPKHLTPCPARKPHSDSPAVRACRNLGPPVPGAAD